jgi:hypothetical protein
MRIHSTQAPRVRRVSVCVAAVAAACLLPASRPAAQAPSRLDRVTEYVERYYHRAQSLMVEETVTLSHLGADLSPAGFARRLVYDLRLDWDPERTEEPASVVRTLLTIGSRPPKPRTEPECLDPKGISPEPLAFLLADRRHRFTFREVGTARTGGRVAALIDYRSIAKDESTVTGTKECISIDMPSREQGRLWVDHETNAILRMEERIAGMTDVRVPRALQSPFGWGLSVSVERSDTTTRYRPVTFTDPDETLLLPESVESLSVIRANGTQRLRMVKSYRNYRRFLTGSRLVPSEP